MHGDVQALVSPWAQPGVDFMHVGDGGEVEEDGRIKGHVESIQLETMLISNVLFKFTVFGKCIFAIFTFIWFFKVSFARKLFSSLVAFARNCKIRVP